MAVISVIILVGAFTALSIGSTSSVAKTRTTGIAGMKRPLTGLIDMGVQTSYAPDRPFPTVSTDAITPYAGSFGGIVVNEGWAQLEPTPGHEKWNDLDASLDAVSTWNTDHPSTPVGVKLRIFGGDEAPAWAKTLGGSPITIITNGLHRTFGRWWTSPYGQAWSSFQHSLAARFDRNPLVRAVSVSSCATLTGEPFVINISRSAIRTMVAAGWTSQAQQRCLQGALADYSGWQHTPITFAFNRYRTVNDGIPVLDTSVTTEIMKACAQSHARGGPECVLGNNGLSDTATTGRSASVYSEIDSLWSKTSGHVGVYFQTFDERVDCGNIAAAIDHHAKAVEVWPPNHAYKGFSGIPAATLRQWNDALQAGRALSCAV